MSGVRVSLMAFAWSMAAAFAQTERFVWTGSGVARTYRVTAHPIPE